MIYDTLVIDICWDYMKQMAQYLLPHDMSYQIKWMCAFISMYEWGD